MGGFARRPEFIMIGNGAIALGDSLSLIPLWHVRVDLDVKDISVMKHLRHRKG